MEQYFGIVDDPRSEEQKALDYKHSDVYGGTVEWKKKELKDLKSYTPRNQNGSLSCCAQGSSKGVETLVGKMMSATPPYRHRANYPAGGMYTADIGYVWYKYGSCLESELNSQKLHESEMNEIVIDDKKLPYKIKGYLQPHAKSIEQIAQAIELWGHCMLIFHANGNEWKGKPVYNKQKVNFGHCVCAVDYFLDEDGNKCVLIEDSASLNTTLDGQHRIITENYLENRCDGAIYFLGVNPLELPFKFTETLKMGSRGLQVKKLQEKLNIPIDGIFGVQTRTAVRNFQIENKLTVDGIVGKNTRAILNK